MNGSTGTLKSSTTRHHSLIPQGHALSESDKARRLPLRGAEIIKSKPAPGKATVPPVNRASADSKDYRCNYLKGEKDDIEEQLKDKTYEPERKG